MRDERITIFEPRDISLFSRSKEAPEEFLELILQQFPEEFKGQFRLFPYTLPQINKNDWVYVGLILRRDKVDDDDPLLRVCGADLQEKLPKMASLKKMDMGRKSMLE